MDTGMSTAASTDRGQLVERYRNNRARSQAMFSMLADDAYYSRPIALRHPIVFYEGHLPGFSFNTLVKRGLGRPGIDARLEALFARGIDPHESQASAARPDSAIRDQWPSRSEVEQFACEADRQVIDALESGDIDRPGHPLLDRAEAAHCILEHEVMHQETLLYLWQRLPLAAKHRPQAYAPITAGTPPEQQWITVPAGTVTLGVSRGPIPFAWDNEQPSHRQPVAAFQAQAHNVTNADFMAFVDAGGYRTERWWRPEDWRWIVDEKIAHPAFWARDADGTWFWRGMFDRLALPASWPVYVSQAEATAYAAWQDARLMTEAEYHRAAYGDPEGGERTYPWGEQPPSPTHGVFNFTSWDPQPAGSHPAGVSAWGFHDLVGNGWEWTSTVFAPFPGFTAMASYPEYSADFFDGQHYVMKGASPATATALLRPSFRNWFRPRYPYVYASFRCAREA
jgi:iron(II)-dependent oxidoreductase